MLCRYTLLLTATDKGVPPHSANATVNITVLDANDNNPTFLNVHSTTVANVTEVIMKELVIII